MRTSIPCLVLAALAASTASAASGQTAMADGETVIRSVRVDLAGETGLDADDLQDRIAARGQGRMIGLRRALRWVPFVPEVRTPRVDLAELQRDRERLRRAVVRSGYPDATVEYDLLPTDDSRVDVVFRIDPGPPLIVTELALEWPDSASADLDPAELVAEIRAGLGLRVGMPLDSTAIEPARITAIRWLADRGYPFGTAVPEVVLDSTRREARVVLRADPGPRTRIGDVRVVENTPLPAERIRRFSGVRRGDLFSLEELEVAGDRLRALDLVRQASFTVPRDPVGDSVIDLELRVWEAPTRDISAQAGYGSDGGLAGELGWTHRHVFGGTRTLATSIGGQSGIWALDENVQKFVRATVSMRQPIGDMPWLTLDVAPFVGYRDDYRDRSLDYGLQLALVRRLGSYTNVALGYEVSTRRIYRYRLGDFSGGVGFLELLQLAAEGVLDSLGTRIDKSVLSVSASIGTLDGPTDPRRGFVVEPSLAVTAPAGITSIQYASADVRASAYLPLSSTVALAGRFGAGRLFPFGKSIPPSPDDAFVYYLRLRDVLFTAGGTRDVRGWDDRFLGPKFPQIVFTGVTEDSTLITEVDRYTPIGGFNRAHGTVEPRWTLPVLDGNLSAHAFLDAGKVWTSDPRFGEEGESSFEDLFWGTGAGINLATPVGALRVEVGYKLNPSLLDLVTAEDFARAILEEIPFDTLTRHQRRRFNLHIGLGTRL